MNAKWYFGALFLICSYFGIFREEVSVPNQEIVLEFIGTEVDQQDIKNAIDEVRTKLLEIGVSDITIEEAESGTLKISYYSAVHIDNIKKALLDETQLLVNDNSKDKEEHQNSLEYKINVYELTDTTDLSKRNDTLVFDIKYHSDRFTNDQNDCVAKYTKNSKANHLYKTAYKSYKSNPFIKDYTSHEEPEVRAGPFTQIIS